MKKYVKAEIIAKNATTGSYAAGCPTQDRRKGINSGDGNPCRPCELAH